MWRVFSESIVRTIDNNFFINYWPQKYYEMKQYIKKRSLIWKMKWNAFSTCIHFFYFDILLIFQYWHFLTLVIHTELVFHQSKHQISIFYIFWHEHQSCYQTLCVTSQIWSWKLYAQNKDYRERSKKAKKVSRKHEECLLHFQAKQATFSCVISFDQSKISTIIARWIFCSTKCILQQMFCLFQNSFFMSE